MNRRAVVGNVLVVPHLLSVPIHWQRQGVESVGDEERDDLFGVLVWSDVVGAAADRNRQSISDVIGVDEQIRAGLAGGIGAAGNQGIALHGTALSLDMAVYFVRADLMKAQVSAFARRLEERIGPVYVGLNKSVGIEDRAVHVRFGREINDRVDLTPGDRFLDPRRVTDIALHERVARAVACVNIGQVLKPSGIGQLVVDRHLNLGIVVQDEAHKVAADKSGAPRYQNVFHRWLRSKIVKKRSRMRKVRSSPLPGLCRLVG